MGDLRVEPEPTDAEAAAIAAALAEVTRPAADVPTDASAVPRWRFSGRWWSAPVSQRRARP